MSFLTDGSLIIDETCLSCLEKNNDENENDQADADSVSEGVHIYNPRSGVFSSGMVAHPNNKRMYLHGSGIREVIPSDASLTRLLLPLLFIIFLHVLLPWFFTWYLCTCLALSSRTLLL
jgi:hypothetical protein